MSDPRPVALVTGAARRLGATIARRLHADGYDLALHYRSSQAQMDALAGELEAARPGSVLCLQADLDAFDRIPELVARTIGRFGRLDALVNNASTFAPTPFGDITPAQWEQAFSSNARAPFFLAQAAAPHLRASGGAIVNMADLYAFKPLPDHAPYCMAKAALVMATRALALELAPRVRVNAIAPGAILWPEGGVDSAERPLTPQQQAIIDGTPLARTGSPAEIAEAVAWLLRGATFTTGQVLHLDGGRNL